MKFAKKLLEKLKHNFFLKLLSLFVAFIMWMVVINTEDPLTVATIRDVPVEILHKQTILEGGKIPEILDGETIDVVVQARKSICDKLTKEDIVAVADFEKLSITNTVPIDVSVNNFSDSDVEIIRGQNQFVKLSLDDFETKEFRVKVVTTGDPRNGYVVASNVASPNVITVSGSKTQLSKITDVYVTIDATDRYDEFTSTLRPVAVDGNNEIVSQDKIDISTDLITVRTLIYATKEVLVNVKLSGEPHEDYEVTGISVQPNKLVVAGLREDLRELPSVLTTEINVEGATNTVEANLNILDLVDKDLISIIAVGDSTVAVKIDIEKQQTEQRLLPSTDIAIQKLNDKFAAQVTKVDPRMIRIQGKRDALIDLTAMALGAYVDLSEIEAPGDYENVPVVFETMFGIKVLSEVTVNVTVTETEQPDDGKEGRESKENSQGNENSQGTDNKK